MNFYPFALKEFTVTGLRLTTASHRYVQAVARPAVNRQGAPRKADYHGYSWGYVYSHGAVWVGKLVAASVLVLGNLEILTA
jgi:hypothetical protein